MSRLTTYAYDLSGNVVRKNLANGLKEARTHDGRNRVSTLKNQTSGGSDVAGYSYQYDRVGTVMQIVEDYPSGSLAGRTITNSYDGVYRLLTEAIATSGGSTVTTTYAYDKTHNRTSKAVSGGTTTTYTLGTGSNGAGANQIISAAVSGGATTTYGYDNNGNRRTRTVSSHTDYSSYDFENRLVELDYETGGTGTGAYLYGYDYRTRRVMRTEPVGVTTNIVFNGGVSILEYTTSAASPAVEYVRGKDYGGGVGGLEYSVRSSSPSFNGYDSRGDVTTKTNGSGTVTFQTGYEAFGNQTVTSGSTLDRQKANTKEQDPTGLLNEGFRYRDPDTGTFITRDPLGFKAGINMYTYVRQNPWTHFDPEGLDDSDNQKKTQAGSTPVKPQPVGDIKDHPYSNTPNPAYANDPKARPHLTDCGPTALRTVAVTMGKPDPGAQGARDAVDKAQNSVGQDWSRIGGGTTSNQVVNWTDSSGKLVKQDIVGKPGGIWEKTATTVLGSWGISSTSVSNTTGPGQQPSVAAMTKIIASSPNPAIIGLNEGHIVTVQFKDGKYEVNNLYEEGGTATFTPKQFMSGQLGTTARPQTINATFPTIEVTSAASTISQTK